MSELRRPAWLDQPVAEEYRSMVEVEPVPDMVSCARCHGLLITDDDELVCLRCSRRHDHCGRLLTDRPAVKPKRTWRTEQSMRQRAGGE